MTLKPLILSFSLASVLLLSACGTSTPSSISLPSASAQAAADAGQALRSEPVRWKRDKPGCKRDCPRIEVDSLAFPEDEKLTVLVDHALATMTGLESNVRPTYLSIAEFEEYYWRTAKPRYAVILKAELKHQQGPITVLTLSSYQFTGGAHGIPATQYLNWDRSAQRVLGLADVLEPGRGPQFVQALERAHKRWLEDNRDYTDNPTRYAELWPFSPSDNYALAKDGVTVKYDAYAIAPYSHGEPELTIPYNELTGILKPAYLPTR